MRFFYCDAGNRFIADPLPLLDLAGTRPQGVTIFELAHPEKYFTKRHAFRELGMDLPLTRKSSTTIAAQTCLRHGRFLPAEPTCELSFI